MKTKLTLIALLLPSFVFAQPAAEGVEAARLGADTPMIGMEGYKFGAEAPRADAAFYGIGGLQQHSFGPPGSDSARAKEAASAKNRAQAAYNQVQASGFDPLDNKVIAAYVFLSNNPAGPNIGANATAQRAAAQVVVQQAIVAQRAAAAAAAHRAAAAAAAREAAAAVAAQKAAEAAAAAAQQAANAAAAAATNAANQISNTAQNAGNDISSGFQSAF